MHLQVLASGSGGNATLVRAGEMALLVDAGLAHDELEKRLATAGQPLFRLDAIVLSHGHLDHARAAGLLSKKSGARVWCSTAMMSNASVKRAKALGALAIGGTVELAARRGPDRVRVTSVVLPHDADPTVALVLEHAGRCAAVCTDMGTFDEAAARALAAAHVLVLEFNHDAELLASGPYTPALKRRVAGPRGHLSNAEAARVLALAAGPGLHTLVLAHLSATNNRPELARSAAEAALRALGRNDVRVLVAEQDVPGPNLAV
jgi:phosphoribosyl 1,2-cyclic phosphodiesterase